MEYSDNNPKESILYWSKRLYQKGMCPSQSGNISIKTGNGIMISASGVCLNDMDENDDSNQEYIETSADAMFDETDTEAVCCGSGMKVKDLLKNDDMTLEELAEMLKNI